MQALFEVQNNFKEREVILTNAQCNIDIFINFVSVCGRRMCVTWHLLEELVCMNGGNNCTVWSPCDIREHAPT